MPEYIYVLSHDGRPLMPTIRKGHVKKLLNSGKARIASHMPFTIQLKYDTEGKCQPLVMGIDPGRSNIGTSVVTCEGKAVFSAVCETRNKEIRRLMEKRRQCRMASRRGERKRRQRRARRFGTALKAGCIMRRLPHYETEILCKTIRNTEARFCNRRRPEGWLTPTVEQLVRTHINLVNKIKKLLPITDVVLEVNRFAFVLLENPEATGLDFQDGPLKGYADVKEAVCDMQSNCCLMCGDEIEAYHHIIPRHKGGSDNLENLAGLCGKCHTKVHTDPDYAKKLQSKKVGLLKKYSAVSTLNQSIPYICKRLLDEMGVCHVFFTDGYSTANVRKALGIEKDPISNPCHVVDAYMIALSYVNAQPQPSVIEKVYHIKQFRRHDRAIINAQRERTYYLGKKVVSKNRRRRFEQTVSSLHEWYIENKRLYGKAEAHRLQQQLTVKASRRSYNNPDRVMPGARFIYQGKEYILTGQLSNGQYYRAYGYGDQNFPVLKCRVIQQNEGLVYVA